MVGITVVCTLATLGARADQPLNIQQLLAAPARWQLVTAADYQVATSEYGARESTGQLTSILRYGLNSRLEVNAAIQGARNELHLADSVFEDSFRGLSAGANWLLKSEDEFPAVLLEGRVQLFSDFAGSAQQFSTAELTATLYKSIDPVVLSMATTLRLRRDFEASELTIDPGYHWSVAPQVNFAVNHRVTLIGGLAFSHEAATTVDGEQRTTPSEQVNLRLGLGYALSPGDTLFFSGDFAATQRRGALSLQWFRVF